jgi:hypothetical protein
MGKLGKWEIRESFQRDFGIFSYIKSIFFVLNYGLIDKLLVEVTGVFGGSLIVTCIFGEEAIAL